MVEIEEIIYRLEDIDSDVEELAIYDIDEFLYRREELLEIINSITERLTNV